MLLRQIYDDDLAQASYIIGCQAKGEAIVIDPRRDVDEYLRIADDNGMRIVAVTETHIHADYLSGTRELARRAKAKIYVSDEGGADWTYGSVFDDSVRMKHGHEIQLGNVTIKAVHTPGHTPEHMSFLVTDGAQASAPGFILTGDFVFVGDVGRPDLLDEAAGGVDTRFQGAKDLFLSLKSHFMTLPDYVQLLPGHGAGSACGKALGSVPTSTVGYEREFSWWAPFVKADDQDGFIYELLSGQPDAHAYFARMKRQNKEGPDLLSDPPSLNEYTVEQARRAIESDQVIFVDTRSHDVVRDGTVAGALNIPGLDKAASYGAWVYDPESETRQLVVLAASVAEARGYYDHFVRVGVDSLAGYVTTFEGLPMSQPKFVQPEELARLRGVTLIDFRNKLEHASGHIPGSVQISGGRILWETDKLPREGTIVTYCQSGKRNSVVASALRRQGYDVRELDGSYHRWSSAPGNKPVRIGAKTSPG